MAGEDEEHRHADQRAAERAPAAAEPLPERHERMPPHRGRWVCRGSGHAHAHTGPGASRGGGASARGAVAWDGIHKGRGTGGCRHLRVCKPAGLPLTRWALRPAEDTRLHLPRGSLHDELCGRVPCQLLPSHPSVAHRGRCAHADSLFLEALAGQGPLVALLHPEHRCPGAQGWPCPGAHRRSPRHYVGGKMPEVRAGAPNRGSLADAGGPGLPPVPPLRLLPPAEHCLLRGALAQEVHGECDG
mmetsp:Transcript_70127/g.226947  ORF Transcript_70127/g.226947 Transcript_70127/m.226947 type:complete len:244 (+) Transcript_70127:2755-3486(+)